MSKDVTYPFADALHVEGLFDGIPLPTTPFMSNALSAGLSNMLPQKVDVLDRLHYAVFNTNQTAPISDLVFRVAACLPEEVALADKKVREFYQALASKLGEGQHMQLRHLTNNVVHYYVVRIFFTSDFKCTHHPEMKLGEPTRPYLCPVCGTMQISGLPHIEDSSE